MRKRLVTQNTPDQFGRTIGQMFGVWDPERREMVFCLHPDKSKAQAFLDQLEFPLQQLNR